MYKTVLVIVVRNVPQFNKFRAPWGVDCEPILNNGNYILPLGWQDVLTEKHINFEVKEVEMFTEDI